MSAMPVTRSSHRCTVDRRSQPAPRAAPQLHRRFGAARLRPAAGRAQADHGHGRGEADPGDDDG
jgi:hypothetical protein